MALANLSDWNSDNNVAAMSACGSGDNPAACGSGDKPSACGSGDKPSACGSGDKPSACGSACGAGDK